MNQKTVINSDLVYDGGMNYFNFPLQEGKVWSEAVEGTGTTSLSIEMGGCVISTTDIPSSDSLPLNYRHLSIQDFSVDGDTITAQGIQVFAGRDGNNDWATPDFTLLPSVPDDVAKMGLPFAVWINVVGFNEFSSSVEISANIDATNAPLMFDSSTLSVDELGAVIVDTMNLTSGDYELTIVGESDEFSHSISVKFTVDNDPDFEILTLDPWIVIPQGVKWNVPTPVFIEPVNGFGADVKISVTVPDGISAQLDFGSGIAPFMSVITLSISDTLESGDYTVIVTGTSGSKVHSDEITISITSLPEFSLEIENREQKIIDGSMEINGLINAHNGLDLSIGGAIDIIIEPYNQKLLDSAEIEWSTIDSNGDLPFTVRFTIDSTIPRNEYTVNLNVISLDGGITHSASVAFVTESSTLDGTAVVADNSSVSTGNTSQHDGTDDSANNLTNNQTSEGNSINDNTGDTDDNSKNQNSAADSESESSNTLLIVFSSIIILGVTAAIIFITIRNKSSKINLESNSEMWTNQSNLNVNQSIDVPQTAQMPVQPIFETQIATAPPPPIQPVRVTDYTGLPPGGQYDQSTGQTIYVQQDGTRWQMMSDGSFTKL